MKLLASDYDGTLCRKSEVTKKDIEAIKKFQSYGNIFGIITGRSIGMIKDELESYQIPYNFLVCNNGGVITNSEGKIIYRNDIDMNTVLSLIDFISKDNTIMMGISDGDLFGTIQEGVEGEIHKDFNEIMNLELTDTDLILSAGKVNSFFLKASTQAKTLELYELCKKQFAGQLNFHFNNGTIDVSQVSVSKKTGADELAKLFCDEVYVIGDGYNDLPMIEAYNGFTVTNADEAIKSKASKIFTSVDLCIEYLLNT